MTAPSNPSFTVKTQIAPFKHNPRVGGKATHRAESPLLGNGDSAHRATRGARVVFEGAQGTAGAK